MSSNTNADKLLQTSNILEEEEEGEEEEEKEEEEEEEIETAEYVQLWLRE